MKVKRRTVIGIALCLFTWYAAYSDVLNGLL